jgi:4-hydroxy-L-threonine phosphate dehydrogenase PdxA
MKGRSKASGTEPLLAITMGDPAGVGPEIIALALEDEVFARY